MGEKTAWFVNKLGKVHVMHTVLRTRLSARDAKRSTLVRQPEMPIQEARSTRGGGGGGLRESRREISIMEALRREAWEGTTRVQNVRDWSVW